VIDVRLTKAGVRERRAELRADERVTLRKSASDWIEVRFRSDADVAFVVELVAQAVAAHRPPPGTAPRSAPRGAELDRRRRFH